MNNIDNFLNQYHIQINNMDIKQGPTSDQLYRQLCDYGADNTDLGSQVSEIVLYVDKQIQNFIGNHLTKGYPIDIFYINKNRGQYLKYLEVYFNKYLPSINEAIQIYLSIDASCYSKVVIQISEYLLTKKVSFKLRLTKINRNDNLLVALYSLSEAQEFISFINTNFTHYIKPLNPFIYQKNNIGIVKDVSKIPYNLYMANVIQDYIEECILNQRSNPYTALDMFQYVQLRFNSADNYKEKQMSYNVLCFMKGIIDNINVFDILNKKYNVYYDKIAMNSYQIKLIDNQYHYYLDNIEVDFGKTIYLNAMECLKHLYVCRYGDEEVTKYQLSNSIVHMILRDIESIMSEGKCNVLINYNSNIVHKLIPFLYGYLALKYKCFNKEECTHMMDIIAKKNVVLIDQNDKYYYGVNNQKIASSIPIIKHNQGFITIDYISEQDNLANIIIIKDGHIKNYLNVYVDIDKVMMRNDHNYYGRLYRNAIGNALFNDERNEEALALRQKDFKAFFISDKSTEVNKYVKLDLIKKIFYQKA